MSRLLTVARRLSAILLVAAGSLALSVHPQPLAAAACKPPANIGSATTEIQVPEDGTYRIWSRIMAASPSDDSYLLEINGTTCITVGDAGLPAGAWAWVDYQGSLQSKINVSLKSGKHSFKAYGRESKVKVDRIVALLDHTCIPVGTGDNCTQPATDAITPSIPSDITAKATGPTQVNLTWHASTDNVGVAGYDIYRASAGMEPTKVAHVTSTSFGDTGLSPTTQYFYYVIAKDAANNASAPSPTATTTTLSDAADTALVYGRLRSADYEPLSYARIVLYGNDTRRIFTTGSDGAYTIPSLKPGTYTIKYTAKGHHSKTKTITLRPGERLHKTVILLNK